MSDIVDAVEMPDQDGKSPGDLWYGLPINPTLATHVWNGREWRPLLTEEGYYRAEITRLRNELHIAQEWSARVIAGREQDISEITALRAENERLKVESIQMQAALGYGILAEDERHILPENPFKCGTCDASKRLRAENERLRAALRNCIGLLDGLVAESGRSIEWGEEDPFRMGEWFEVEDLEQIKEARAALAAPSGALEEKQ